MQPENWFKRNMVALVGFGLQLVVFGVYLGRQEQVIRSLEQRTMILEQRMTIHHEDGDIHTTSEWRSSVINQLSRIDGKLDAHIMSNGKR